MSSKKLEINYVRDFELCDRDHFKIIKGISMLAVLIIYILSTFLKITWLNPLRSVAAAVFLFCSGYGVAESFRRKRGLVHYWENKMIKVWIPSLVAMIILSLIKENNFMIWIVDSPIGLKGELLYLLFGCYAAFWVLFYFVENRAVCCIGLFVIAGIAAPFISNNTLISLLPSFPLGVVFHQCGMKYKIRAMKVGGQIAIFMACLVMAAAGWVLRVRTENPYIELLLDAVTAFFGAMLLLVGVYAAKSIPVFGVFVPFGYMAFGLYLFYDDILLMLSYAKDTETCVMIIAFLLVVAAVYSWLREMLILLNKNIRRRNSTHLKGSMWR